MKRLYFNIDKENNKVILDRKDFDYLMSIGHYNDKAIEYIEKHKPYWEEWHYDNISMDDYIDELLKILKGSDSNE